MEKVTVGLEIEKRLKDLLAELAEKDFRSQTYHLEKALLNYFVSKKLLPPQEAGEQEE